MQSLKLLSAARLLGHRLAALQSRSSSHFVLTEAEIASHRKSARLWAVLSFVIALPCVAFGFYNMEKREHEFHESHPDGPLIPNWEWNHITKPFPWGNGKQPLFEFLTQKHPEIYPPPEKDE